MSDPEDPRQEGQEPASFGREIGTGIREEVRSWLRWAAFGAGLGAVVLGVTGFWYFGATGLAIGAAMGAVVGGIGAWLLYLNA
ncbi:MAG: hypothetical protein R3F30_09170 [Planctomycetota bacterium]